MKKMTIATTIVLVISILLLFILLWKNPYSFSYSMATAFILLLSSLVFLKGIIKNDKNTYKNNITIYIILYFVLLISLTLLINRPTITFLNSITKETINLIPLKTIINFIKSPMNLNIKMINLLGNLPAFIPLSFLLLLKDEKFSNLKRQFIYIGITVISIEIIQLVTATGRLDIDDFILNVLGVILFVVIVKKTNIIKKVKQIFCSDFHMTKPIKYGLWTITVILIIMFDTMMIVDITTIEQIVNQTFYVEEKSDCNTLEKIEMDEYNLYLNCIDVIYENKDHYQTSLEEALKNKSLTRKIIKEELTKREIAWQEGASTYIDKQDNISFVLCHTPEGNQDIYVGNVNMRYEEDFCK